jgi:hypothetical protein
MYAEYFDRRRETFLTSLTMIRKSEARPYVIVELGTSRSFVNGRYEGCCSPNPKYWAPNSPERWDWGAGIFTKVFADNLKDVEFNLYSVDPSPAATFISRTMCAGNASVKVFEDYSTPFLKSFPDRFKTKIDFLYMDHLESHDARSAEEAAVKHLEDCKVIVALDLMSPTGLILVDDVGDTYSKGKYSIPFLQLHGYTVVQEEYQVLLSRRAP